MIGRCYHRCCTCYYYCYNFFFFFFLHLLFSSLDCFPSISSLGMTPFLTIYLTVIGVTVFIQWYLPSITTCNLHYSLCPRSCVFFRAPSVGPFWVNFNSKTVNSDFSLWLNPWHVRDGRCHWLFSIMQETEKCGPRQGSQPLSNTRITRRAC